MKGNANAKPKRQSQSRHLDCVGRGYNSRRVDAAMRTRAVKRLANRAAAVADKAAAPQLWRIVDANDGETCDIGGLTPDICQCTHCYAGRRLNRNK